MWGGTDGSAWASAKSGDIVSLLTQEDIDAFNEKPPKKTSKNCVVAYVPGL